MSVSSHAVRDTAGWACQGPPHQTQQEAPACRPHRDEVQAKACHRSRKQSHKKFCSVVQLAIKQASTHSTSKHISLHIGRCQAPGSQPAEHQAGGLDRQTGGPCLLRATQRASPTARCRDSTGMPRCCSMARWCATASVTPSRRPPTDWLKRSRASRQKMICRHKIRVATKRSLAAQDPGWGTSTIWYRVAKPQGTHTAAPKGAQPCMHLTHMHRPGLSMHHPLCGNHLQSRRANSPALKPVMLSSKAKPSLQTSRQKQSPRTPPGRTSLGPGAAGGCCSPLGSPPLPAPAAASLRGTPGCSASHLLGQQDRHAQSKVLAAACPGLQQVRHDVKHIMSNCSTCEF